MHIYSARAHTVTETLLNKQKDCFTVLKHAVSINLRVELLFSMVKKFHEEIPNFLCILIETIGKFQTKSDLHEEV